MKTGNKIEIQRAGTESTHSRKVPTDIRYQVAEMLLDIDAIKIDTENGFQYSSGKRGSIYVDIRLLLGNPQFRKSVNQLSFFYINNNIHNFDIIAGGETAGIPFATMLANSFNKPLSYIRKQPKNFGKCSQIEGLSEKDLSQNKNFLLVEDLINDGGSKLNFINAIHNSGNTITDIFVIFEYTSNFKIREKLAEKNITLHSLTDLDMLISVMEYKNYDNIDKIKLNISYNKE